MATVAKMDNGEFLMSYEWYDTDPGKPCPIRVETSTDGVTWNEKDIGVVLSTPDGIQPYGSPYTIWDPVDKQLILSARAMRGADDITAYTRENECVVLVNKDHGTGVPASTDVCGPNSSPDLLLLPNGAILYTKQASIDASNPKYCIPRTDAAEIATLPYKSDSSANGQAGWIDFDGDWSIADDQYAFAPVTDTATIALTGSSGWTGYEISADVIITSSSGMISLAARTSASKTAPNSLAGYTAAIESNRGTLALYRVTDQATVLHSEAHPGGIHANKPYHLSASVQSAEITVTLTENGWSNTTFSRTDDVLKSGSAGLYGSHGSVRCKNVQIASLA
ncbi:uncharacterized protein BJX67DRAFT_379619 [Aspergillus lucknowensis]|uniref:Uncharacterized protein n=1 Tax=Aspergillus lucknowensis TaxID=176173 RepID=A0ABR4LY77_9EURO